MNFLQCHWLGFAETPQEALRIIQDTGIFYLIIALGYLLSFLYMRWHSAAVKKRMHAHILGMVIWATLGECLVLRPALFGMYFNALILIFTFFILYQLQFTSALLGQASLSLQKANTEDKKAMYAGTMLIKTNFSLSDMMSLAIINEQILWLLILYKAAVGFRASFGII